MPGLAKTLRTAREALAPRVSQARVARVFDMDPKTVGRWERGESIPELETLKRLADLYGLEWYPLLRQWSDAKLGTSSREESVDDALSVLSGRCGYLQITLGRPPQSAPHAGRLPKIGGPSKHEARHRAQGLGLALVERSWLTHHAPPR